MFTSDRAAFKASIHFGVEGDGYMAGRQNLSDRRLWHLCGATT